MQHTVLTCPEHGYQGYSPSCSECARDRDARCHCGADMGGSDHCPCCGCEQYETYCDHVCPAPAALAIDHADHVSYDGPLTSHRSDGTYASNH